MRKFIIHIGLLLSPLSVFAQVDVVEMEYFFDIDPGHGLGTAIAITPGPTQDLNLVIPAAALPQGYHLFCTRARDTDGDWGPSECRMFLITPSGTPEVHTPADVTDLEYFIDDDPGQGNGTAIACGTCPGNPIDFSTIASTSALPEGYHTISVRARDADNDWGMAETRVFLIAQSGTPETPVQPDVVAMEYFFDNDPGHGNATPIPAFTPSGNVDLTEIIVHGQSAGSHLIGVRALDSNGEWGMTFIRNLFLDPEAGTTPTASDVAEIEYFYNDDPGHGNATDLPITPGPLIDLNPANLPTSVAIPVGTNILGVRAKNTNGEWGTTEITTFDVMDDCTQPVADFNIQLACAGEVVTFQDQSTNLQPDATYKWYLDGDEIADNTTTGDVTFTYPNPGDYVAALAIRQGQICLDSIGYNFTIEPKPVVFFSVTNLTEGSLTSFDVETSNVPPGATWEWDFESDAIIDDNTAGNTSHTFPTAADYTTTLLVTDGIGCEDTYSRTFTISPSGGGGSGPSADFIASDECLGTNVTFTDLSENIPPGAVYSWDFDNDGVEDDNTTGTTQFGYPSSGPYTTVLTIDLGGGNLLNTSQAIEITDVPQADFQSTYVCQGATTDFTDLSTEVDPAATYEWDFDDDGTVDDTTVGSTSYSYPVAGSYLVTLQIDNGSGCVDLVTRQVIVDPLPVSSFTANDGCVGQSISFTDSSVGAVTGSLFEWDFDNDGSVDATGTNGINYLFGSASVYYVSLTLTQPSGCADTFVQQIQIWDDPAVLFSVANGCQGEVVMFTDMSTDVAAGALYSWDFDNDGIIDDTTSTSTSHMYTGSGVFEAVLTIDNGGVCQESFSSLVDITASPVPIFSIGGGCVGENIVFFDVSTGVTPNATYSWDFDGDGTEDSNATGDISFVYGQTGGYSPSLTIDNGSGCTETYIETIELFEIPLPAFEIQSDCFGLPSTFIDLSSGVSAGATYQWDFDGDGVIDDSSVGNTSFTFPEFKPYVARLTIDNGLGCSDYFDVIVDFKNAAAPDFQVSPACFGQEVVFTDLSAELETSAIYSWDFNGDGVEDSSVPGSTFFSYGQAGVYQASLTIFNGELCSATKTISVDVTGPPDLDLGQDVQLCSEGTVTLDAGAGYATYFWSNGSTEQSITVDQFGEYWVAVTDVKGCQNLDTTRVRLRDLPEAGFEYNVRYSPIDGIIVSFTNVSSEAISQNWTFGDGTTSTELAPEHVFSDFFFFSETPYEICLSITDVCGLVSTYCEVVFLSPLNIMSEANEGEIILFPNPATERLAVTFNGYGEITYLMVLDESGRFIYDKKDPVSGYQEIDVTQWKQGVYLVLLLVDERWIFRKVLVH